MPQIEEDQANLESLDVEQAGNEGQGNLDTSKANNDSDFLVVNERTRFRSQEDAIKSFNEAGERIASLSAWEKEMKRYGVSDPAVARQLLDELVQRRQKEEQTGKEAKAAEERKKAAEALTKNDDGEDLTKEELEARKWLQKTAPKLGFVPKDELLAVKEELMKQIQELRGSSESSREEQRNALVDSGRENVRSFMGEQKIVDNADGEKQSILESLIRDWVNADEERVSRFYASPSSSKALLKEGFDRAVKALGWGRQDAVNAAKLALDKGRALTRNRRAPTRAGDGSEPVKDQVRKDAGGKKDFIGSAHEKAWEIAQKHFSGTSNE